MYLFRVDPVNLSSNVRILHGIPNAPNVDVYASGNLIATNVPFGEISEYKPLTHGEYEFQIYKAGTYDTPLYSQSINILPKSFNTLSIININNTPSFLHLIDSNSVSDEASLSFLRFINLSPNAPLLSLAMPNGNVLFRNVEYAETTGYYPLSAGIYNFMIQINPSEGISKFIRETQLLPGRFYTVYIVGLLGAEPPIGYSFIQDGV